MSLRIAFFLFLATSVSCFTLRPHSLYRGRVSITRRLSDESVESIATIAEETVVTADVPQEVVADNVVQATDNVVDGETESESEDVAKTKRYTVYIGNLPYCKQEQSILFCYE